MNNLRSEPLIEIGFKEAVKQIAHDAELRGGFSISLKIDKEIDHWEYEVIHGTYRIIQEALQNIIKHAEATNVEISLQTLQSQEAELVISDDGKGFSMIEEKKGTHHFGMTIMRERALSIGAEFEIEPNIGSGTKIRLLYRSAT